MPSLNKIKFVVPKALARFVGKDVPRESKLMSARGALPLPPKDLSVVLFFLTHDSDPEIKSSSEKSLISIPPPVLKGILDSPETHPLILDFYARRLDLESGLLESIALNRVTHDETVLFLAAKPAKRLVEIISNNQTRILRYPPIVEALGNNPMVGQSTIDRILHFIHLETGLKAREDYVVAPPEGTTAPEQPQQEAAPENQPVEQLPDYMQGEEYPWMEEGEGADHWIIADMPPDLTEDYDRELDEHEKLSLNQRIAKLGISEKIKMAMLGNKEARNILIKDPNKLVSGAVLTSPKLSDNEIEGMSRSRSVSDEIIRHIATNNEWTRNYAIKLNLVNNTKTPLPIAMRFLNFLTPRDVQNVSRSKNIAAQVATAAKKLLQKRMDRKG